MRYRLVIELTSVPTGQRTLLGCKDRFLIADLEEAVAYSSRILEKLLTAVQDQPDLLSDPEFSPELVRVDHTLCRSYGASWMGSVAFITGYCGSVLRSYHLSVSMQCLETDRAGPGIRMVGVVDRLLS